MEIWWIEVLTPFDMQSNDRLLGGKYADNREKPCSSLLPKIMDDICFHNMLFIGFTYKIWSENISNFDYCIFRIHIFIFFLSLSIIHYLVKQSKQLRKDKDIHLISTFHKTSIFRGSLFHITHRNLFNMVVYKICIPSNQNWTFFGF